MRCKRCFVEREVGRLTTFILAHINWYCVRGGEVGSTTKVSGSGGLELSSEGAGAYHNTTKYQHRSSASSTLSRLETWFGSRPTSDWLGTAASHAPRLSVICYPYNTRFPEMQAVFLPDMWYHIDVGHSTSPRVARGRHDPAPIPI